MGMNRMVVIVLVCLAATALWGVAATVLWGVTVFYPWYKQHAADPLSITGPAEELDMTNGPKSREVMVDIIGNQVITRQNRNSVIHQRRSVTTLSGPPSAMFTICRATVSMIVLFSSWYRCRS